MNTIYMRINLPETCFRDMLRTEDVRGNSK